MLNVSVFTGPWQVQVTDRASPAGPGTVLTIHQGLGLRALAALRSRRIPVGPVVLCPQHGLLHIPVTRNPYGPVMERTGRARISETDSCPYDAGHRAGRRHDRIWLLPGDDHWQTGRTSLDALADGLQQAPVPLSQMASRAA